MNRRRITGSQIVVWSIFIVYAIRFLTNSFMDILTAVYVILGALALFYAWLKIPDSRRVLWMIAVFDLFCLWGSTVNANHSALYMFLLLPCQGCAVLLFYKKKNLYIAECMHYFIMAFFIVKIAGYLMRGETISAISISSLIGRNSISIILIQFLAMDLLYRIHSDKKIAYFWYLCACAICFLLMGRGGILSLCVFFIGMVICSSRYADRGRISPMRIGFMAVLFIASAVFFYQIVVDYAHTLSKDYARIKIWTDYLGLAGQSVKNIIFGANLGDNQILIQYDNMHNAFLNLHYFYGAVPLLFMLWLIAAAFLHYKKKRQYKMLVVILTMVIRGMTDATSFAFDYIWFYLLCEIMQDHRGKKSLKQTERTVYGKNSNSRISGEKNLS